MQGMESLKKLAVHLQKKKGLFFIKNYSLRNFLK